MKPQLGKYYYKLHRNFWGVWQYTSVSATGACGSFVKDFRDIEEAREFVELVRANDTHFIGVLAGHIHASVEYNITDNLKQYTTSSALIGYGREIIIK